PRAGHVGNAPGKIAKQSRKAEQIGAAVQVQDVSVCKRAGRGDPLGFDTAGVNYDQFGSARRGRHEMREAGHSSTDILDLNVRWKPLPHEPRQAEADKFGAQTHLFKPPERTRSRTSSSAGGPLEEADCQASRVTPLLARALAEGCQLKVSPRRCASGLPPYAPPPPRSAPRSRVSTRHSTRGRRGDLRG